MTLSPLRRFILQAVLWLPLSFCLWAVFASPVIWPPAKIGNAVLTRQLPDTVTKVEQNKAQLEIETTLRTEPDPQGRVGVIVLQATPMIYAWCLPLFAGLVMATPLSGRRRVLQIAIAFPILWIVVSWGAVFDVLYLLQFKAGPLGAAALARNGWSEDAIALGYQFGYLILPAVTPVALWILQNQRFLETLVGWRREPDGAGDGPSADPAAPAVPAQDSGDRPA
ncbi:exosortase H-associated membrane protein [Chiayiivirga flava]|uniref:Uncharacterized protein n=1 Tax=Chiayiivirga flava TaxID=659595 RepID=A0A7W8G0T7_9GAMM|nr:exosortase H-associated membrane protein [Chiayiivirga flava]MBB5208689.1 hypothetical protein [Chiayiivirga flava]